MSHPKLTKIDSFFTEFEAKAACNLLLDRGIPAYIEGAAGQTVLSYLGPAMSGVRLLVEQEHEMLAKQILAESSVASSSGGPWTCGTCFSEVDDGFEVCWKCGSLRAESEWEAGDDDEGDLEPKQLSYAGLQPESETNVVGGNNPYQAPNSKLVRHAEEVSDLQKQQEAILERAWKASIIGLIFLPVVAHLYSLWLLLGLLGSPVPFTEKARTRFLATLFISIAAIIGCGLLVGTFDLF